jgi:hypothetical protein
MTETDVYAHPSPLDSVASILWLVGVWLLVDSKYLHTVEMLLSGDAPTWNNSTWILALMFAGIYLLYSSAPLYVVRCDVLQYLSRNSMFEQSQNVLRVFLSGNRSWMARLPRGTQEPKQTLFSSMPRSHKRQSSSSMWHKL